MLRGMHTHVSTRSVERLKSIIIQRDGLYCCKKHGCRKVCKFEDLLLDRMGDFNDIRNLHLLCRSCFTLKLLQPPMEEPAEGSPPAH